MKNLSPRITSSPPQVLLYLFILEDEDSPNKIKPRTSEEIDLRFMENREDIEELEEEDQETIQIEKENHNLEFYYKGQSDEEGELEPQKEIGNFKESLKKWKRDYEREPTEANTTQPRHSDVSKDPTLDTSSNFNFLIFRYDDKN